MSDRLGKVRLMIKAALKSIAPANSRDLYHHARRLTGRDIHERVSAVTLRHIARYQFARDYVSGLSVVDVACGNGYGSMIFNNALNYRGYDLDRKAIKNARADYPSAVFDVQSIYSLPIGAARWMPWFPSRHLNIYQNRVVQSLRLLEYSNLAGCSSPVSRSTTPTGSITSRSTPRARPRAS